LALVTSLLVLLFNITPLSSLWFLRFTAFPPQLATLAQQSMWVALPLPALATAQSWFQGRIMHNRKTQAISEAVIIYLVITSLVFMAGIAWGKTTGLLIGVAALTISSLVQVGWLWLRGRRLVS
jgi:hypothetical protein